MGLLNNPCRKCEFSDRCTDPALLRSYVTSADEDGCPTYARLKNQTNIAESWNAMQAEQEEELNSMNETSMDNSADDFDAHKLFADAFAAEERKQAAERKLREQLRRNNASVQNESEEYDVFKGLRQDYAESQHSPQPEKMSKAAQKQAMLDAMSPEERASYEQKEAEKKQKALEKKEQDRKKKELQKQKEEEEELIHKKRLHTHQAIFWSIYLISAIIGYVCSDEWWHYVLLVLGLIVLAVGRGFVRMITD